MASLIDPKNTIEILKKYGFSFSKRYGQNFLIDAHVLAKIIAAAEITKEDTVVEIGPGIGTLTQALAEAAGHVYAVEIDSRLIPILEDTLSGYENVTVIHEDILKVDLRELSESLGGVRFKIVANLPYYITTPIIMGILEEEAPVDSLTVMVQKEVARRMQSGPGSKDYGALSLSVQYYAEPYLAANVPMNSFMPRPNVDSAVIRLRVLPEPSVPVEDRALLFRLIRAGFNERRKTLLNALRNAEDLDCSREEIEEALRSIGKAENVRGETLTLREFAALSDALTKLRRGLPPGREEQSSEAAES